MVHYVAVSPHGTMGIPRRRQSRESHGGAHYPELPVMSQEDHGKPTTETASRGPRGSPLPRPDVPLNVMSREGHWPVQTHSDKVHRPQDSTITQCDVPPAARVCARQRVTLRVPTGDPSMGSAGQLLRSLAVPLQYRGVFGGGPVGSPRVAGDSLTSIFPYLSL